ncbi:hypothetical protein B5M09_009176 [Aphanomyces astaci]|uniref:BEACH domain-containing protein n=1 Tax=Aphanomyces astaci TaxID=112090 RepID=A0A3R7WZ09_APHAT|nr:hypothetical protein B5M09_009176 [Aphanomyces astaci]
MLRRTPPSYFVVQRGNQVTLPLLRWTFRGFSMALWMRLPLSQEGKKIRLFKFYSTSKSQGIECWITPHTDDRMALTVSSITDDKGWRHVSSQFQWTPDTWHFVVVCHRQHYLKKSHVVSYVDGMRVINEDLSFPTPLGPMVQCLIGGADVNTTMGTSHMSGMTMYEDELHIDAIAALYRHGPTETCLRRIPTGVSPFLHSVVASDALCPLTSVDKRSLGQLSSNAKVVFSFNAQDALLVVPDESPTKQPPPPSPISPSYLCVQWTSEGDVDSDAGWTRFKMDAAFLPQEQIHLDGAVSVVAQPNRSDAWFRHGGILAIPVLLDQLLTSNSITATLLSDALHVMQELLRSSVAHQEDMLHGYGFHVLSHVLRMHATHDMADLLTPSIATTVVELVLNLWPESLDKPIAEHAMLPPLLFAAGVHGLLLDFHLWTLAPYKTQSLLIQQLVAFVTQHPRCFEGVVQAQHILDILRTFYAADVNVLESDKTKQQEQRQWIDECVASLVLLLHRSLAAADDKDVLHVAAVRLPFRVVTDLRAIGRFLLTATTDNAVVTRAVLAHLCDTVEKSEPSKTMACVAANVVEAAVHLMGPKHGWGVRTSAMRLFVLLFEWLETDSGRSLVQSVERTYQAESVADPKLWNDLAHDNVFNMGLQHSMVLNDLTSNRHSMDILPLSDQSTLPPPPPPPPLSSSSSPPPPPTRKESKDASKQQPPSWWKQLVASSNRLVLTYADRLTVLRSIALRQMSLHQAKSCHDAESLHFAVGASMQWLLALPLRGLLPFVSSLFLRCSTTIESQCDREKMLMEISVGVKTDAQVQLDLLAQPSWVVWLGDLLASCESDDPTGQDLVLDTIVTLLCRALYNSNGCLCVDQLFARFPSLPWRRRVLALVFLRTARNKSMLSRAVSENLYRLLMLATFLLAQEAPDHVEYLLTACVDVTEMLLESTHSKHRAGIIPGLRLCRMYLSQLPTSPLPRRMLQLLASGLQQEVSQRLPIDESIQTHDMLLRVLTSLAVAHPSVDCSELVLRIATCGLFDKQEELSVDRLSSMDAASAVQHVFEILVVGARESLHEDEVVDWSLWVPKWFPQSSVSSSPIASVVAAASQVEEKRMGETIKDIAKKELDRMTSLDAGVHRRQQWTARSWDQCRYKVLSEQIRWEDVSLDGCCSIYPPTSSPPTHEYQLTRHETPFPSRRRHRMDVYFKPTLLCAPTTPPPLVMSTDELEKVGRAIATQGGAVLNNETIPDDNTSDFDAMPPPSPRRTDADEADDKDDEDEVMSMPSHGFAFLHPSSGRGLDPNDRVYLQPLVRKVVPEGLVLGSLSICDHAAVFQPTQSSESDDVEVASGLQGTHRWAWKDVVAVYLRRFRLRESAVELFVQDGTAHFLDFHVPDLSSVAVRDESVRLILAMCPRATIKQWPMMSPSRLIGNLTKEWQARLALNTLSGRSFNDLTQYPVFPWVLSNYSSEHLDLSDPANYRPLNQPMGALNPDRLAEFWERYHSFDDPVIPKFLYGSHYSTAAGSVLYYLMRLQPYASLHKLTQGGSFDLPDRVFNSVRDVWNMCNSSMSEVKELTPEWFSTPAFLRNVHQYDFGTRQDGIKVGDVELPPWAQNDPDQFIRLHRAALESDHVSAHLHEWIDLIFGFQQRGPDALAANNVFYYLTYSGLVDLDSIDDLHLRNAMEQQIAHFGQCPQQLFRTPHPARGPSSTRPLQEYPPTITKALTSSLGMCAVKVLGDRVVGVNSLGVIELHHWKLQKSKDGGDKWAFKTERDASPFDVVPRVPVYATTAVPTVAISSQGRVIVSGGAPTGTVHIRLVDVENGHVMARASVDGHAGVVTCLAMDVLGDDECFVSGSTDCSVLLWQLSHMNSPFRPPRVSSCPLMAFRGHRTTVSTCALSVPLGLVVSASDSMCLTTNDTSVVQVYNLMGTCIRQHAMELCTALQLSRDGSLLTASLPQCLRSYRVDDFSVAGEFAHPKEHAMVSCSDIGPHEADMLAVTGHADGSLVWHVLPDADGHLSVLGSVGRFLNLNSKLKVVKGTVQQAQKLAISTIDNAHAVSNTAKDIADEAKSMMQTIFGLFK